MDEAAVLTLLRYALELLRYENGLGARVAAILREVATRLVADLRVPGTMSAAERDRAMREIAAAWRQRATPAYDDVLTLLRAELPQIAAAYREATARLLGVEVGTITGSLPTVQGVTLDRWIASQRETLLQLSDRALRAGVAAGENSDQVADRVRAVVATRAREAATLARTAATRAAAAGQESAYRAAGAERYRYVAVLDERTTRTGGYNDRGCWGLNGLVFRFDNPSHPRPGWHWNCRSHIEPVFEADLGGRPGIGRQTRDIVEAAGLDLEEVQAAERRLLARGGGAVGTAAVPQGWARNPALLLRGANGTIRRAVLGTAGARRLGIGLTLGQIARREAGRLTLDELRIRLL